ncbi:unnamed protein product (macronuclear) [Paramecium tetraurelia]|uniref:Thioredoxin domain-containing protein n=1 Tax=Paramecium tetraurelia TaxID=5888 RepID=A0CCE5_PARTE|nr:uncharacterized protein GSPATT00037247001 [Paramecium tetraurelia]CAK68462.1 unnamed protein product [Paramecium tetraurelia]|eukprot:XP_001435859.1 hypothetical protein (macronuclear) [Paramecium tetraurelia strain d4-2]
MTLLLATHKACKACCIHEVIFKQLLQDLPKQVNFLRIELEDNVSFIEQYQIKRFPAIFLETKSGVIYHYNDLLHYETLLSFIHYYLNGLQFTQFHSLQEIESAINNQHNQQSLYDIYIIGLFYDQVEYHDEIKHFTQQCKKLYNYRIKFGFLMQKSEIKNIYSKFNTYSHILISRFPNHYQFVDDLLAQPIVPLINELKFDNSKYYLGHALIVMDSIQDNQNYLLKIQKIALQLPSLRFAWIDGNLNEDRLQMLGIEKFDQEIKLTIFNLDSNANAIYNGDLHNLTTIFTFYKDFLSMDSKHFHQKYSFIKKEQNKSPSQPYIQYNENTLIILIPQYDEHHTKIIKQLQQVNKKFHNQFHPTNSNQFIIIILSFISCPSNHLKQL